MQRLGVAGGGSRSSNNYTPNKAINNASEENSAAQNVLALQQGAGTAIGASVIGSGLGLGNERDKKRHVSAAHALVLLSLKTLSYLSVPSSRLILLIKVCLCFICIIYRASTFIFWLRLNILLLPTEFV